MDTFNKAYKILNKQQKAAVDTIDGPVMVIAGPGTGKTQILTLRIANILEKTQTAPSSILALTFTDNGVKAMKERLVEFIGPTGYQVNVFTFHAFCQSVMEDNPEYFPTMGNMEILGDLEKVEIFQTLFDTLDLNVLKPKNSPYYYIKNVDSKISDLKREGISPEEFAQIITDEESLDPDDYINKRTGKPTQKYNAKIRQITKWKELLMLYKAYQTEMLERNLYDYNDMITFVVEAFSENDDLLAKYQERYQYILADEYQDTNSTQNEVIRLLTSFEYLENPNVFVVGDDEQSIYRFQGASMENFNFFEKNYPEVKKITLQTNYRSTQNILDASRSVIANNENNLEDVERMLKAHQEYANQKINIVKLSHEITEKYFLASKIKELIADGVAPCEIAVLYKTNKEGLDISESLGRFGIKVQTVKGENVLDDLDIKKLIKILQVIFEQELEIENQVNDNFFWTGERSDKDVNLFTVMHYDLFGIEPSDILKLVKQAKDEKKHLYEVLDESGEMVGTPLDLSLRNSQSVLRFWQKILKWKKDAANEPFSKFLELVIHESGMIDSFLDSDDKVDRLNKLNKFFGAIKEFNYSKKNLNLADFFKTLSLRQKENISIPANDLKRDDDAVQLMTAHSSKGLEYEYVFITRCVEGNWGDKRRSEALKLPNGVVKFTDLSKIEKNEDERRLFYVAMTRAKKGLFISFAQTYSSNNQDKSKLPSVFVNELREDIVDYIDVSEYEENLEEALKVLVTLPVKKHTISIEEKEFLEIIVKNISVSPTSLNTYLQCPYKFKLDRLFGIPKVKERPLAFGTAVHKALEDTVREYKASGEFLSVEDTLKSFKTELGRQLMSKQDYDDLLKYGEKVVTEYLEELNGMNLDVIGNEYNFGNRNVYLDGIKLTGKVDRIDYINRDRKEVRVVDYKTGKPKSLNAIIGKTQNPKEEYKRQLVFYKLMSQLDRGFSPKVVRSTRLEFVEKGDNGKYKPVDYEVTDADLKKLRETIRDTVKKIKNIEFEKTEEKKNCEYCPYQDHCWPEGIPN